MYKTLFIWSFIYTLSAEISFFSFSYTSSEQFRKIHHVSHRWDMRLLGDKTFHLQHFFRHCNFDCYFWPTYLQLEPQFAITSEPLQIGRS